jgi:hypothetical protein
VRRFSSSIQTTGMSIRHDGFFPKAPPIEKGDSNPVDPSTVLENPLTRPQTSESVLSRVALDRAISARGKVVGQYRDAIEPTMNGSILENLATNKMRERAAMRSNQGRCGRRRATQQTAQAVSLVKQASLLAAYHLL